MANVIQCITDLHACSHTKLRVRVCVQRILYVRQKDLMSHCNRIKKKRAHKSVVASGNDVRVWRYTSVHLWCCCGGVRVTDCESREGRGRGRERMGEEEKELGDGAPDSEGR